MKRKCPVSEEQKKQFAALYLIHKMNREGLKFPILLEGNNRDLEPILEWLMARDCLEIEKDSQYILNTKSSEVARIFGCRYLDFLRHFDVYSAVDLATGEFAFEHFFKFENDADWQEFLHEDRWDDLRLAVCAYKEAPTLEMVFMSFLQENRFGQNMNGAWQFDLLLGSIWKEIISISENALYEEHLGYVDEEKRGEVISGKAVLRDIILQGASLNKQLVLREIEDSGDENDSEEPSLESYERYLQPNYLASHWRSKFAF